MTDTSTYTSSLLNPEAANVHLSREVLEEIVRRIVDAVPTDSIYIFGSYARGEETPESDIDVFLVTEDERKSWIEYGVDARRALSNYLFSNNLDMDLIVHSKEKFNTRKDEFGMIPWLVVDEGVKLYG